MQDTYSAELYVPSAQSSRQRLAMRLGAREWHAVWPLLSLVTLAVELVLFFLIPEAHNYPGVVAAGLTFFMVQLLLPSCHPVQRHPLCPWNWVLLIFFLQLVLLPLSVLVFGPKLGQLPTLPSNLAINAAMIINAVAFASFCVAYHHFSRHSKRRHRTDDPFPQGCVHYRYTPPGFIPLYIAVGLSGIFLAFRSLHKLGQYFSDPHAYLARSTIMSGSLVSAAGTFLRPFLGVGIVILWCRWLDRRRDGKPGAPVAVVTVLMMLAVTLSMATFHYNRGTVVATLIPMIAVLLGSAKRGRRGAVFSACVFGFLILFLVPFYGAYRSGDFTVGELTANSSARSSLAGKVHLVQMFQVYGGAPQFLGFFLQTEHWGANPRWGSVVVSSVLSPLPILGKPFRQSSGTAIYNKAIYGWLDAADQIAPFQGETYLDFNIAGVIMAFFLLGWIAHGFERAFESSKCSFDIFVWQYVAVQTFFLVYGSIEVVSQTYIYFFPPFYLYFIYRRLFLCESPAFSRQTKKPRAGLPCSVIERR